MSRKDSHDPPGGWLSSLQIHQVHAVTPLDMRPCRATSVGGRARPSPHRSAASASQRSPWDTKTWRYWDKKRFHVGDTASSKGLANHAMCRFIELPSPMTHAHRHEYKEPPCRFQVLRTKQWVFDGFKQQMSIAKDSDGHGTALQPADAKAIPVEIKETMLVLPVSTAVILKALDCAGLWAEDVPVLLHGHHAVLEHVARNYLSTFCCNLSAKASHMRKENGQIPIEHVVFDAAIQDKHVRAERTPQGPKGHESIKINTTSFNTYVDPVQHSLRVLQTFPVRQHFWIWCLAVVLCNLSQVLAILDETSPSQCLKQTYTHTHNGQYIRSKHERSVYRPVVSRFNVLQRCSAWGPRAHFVCCSFPNWGLMRQKKHYLGPP